MGACVLPTTEAGSIVIVIDFKQAKNHSTNMTDSVEQHIFLARVAEQAERFNDMVTYLEKVLDSKGAEVDSDERNLLSVAFKNLIASKRQACRTIVAIE